MAGRLSGVIVRLVRDGGYGFIRTASGAHWLFLAADTVGTPFERLSEDQVVTFEVWRDPQGHDQRAVNVQVA